MLTTGADGKRTPSLLAQAYSQVDIHLISLSINKEFEWPFEIDGCH
jgi:hypothetical protein